MNVMITDRDESINYIEMTCGKKTVSVVKYNYGQVKVVVLCNTSFRTNQLGYGKMFSNFQQAIDNYKSKEVKAILEAAKVELN